MWFTLLISSIAVAPSAEHMLLSKHIYLDALELEDHSKWEIAPPDAYKVVGWQPQDKMVLTPHWSWFSSYKYQYSMTNLTRNSHIRVNFISHPCDYKQKAQWIISIDKFSSKVFLSDGTSWSIHPNDAPLIKEWDINDFIIYGKNDQLLNTHPFLLIHVRLNHAARAIEL